MARLRLGLADAFAPEAHGFERLPRSLCGVFCREGANQLRWDGPQERRQRRTIVLFVLDAELDRVP
jgi:hypothetical protein